MILNITLIVDEMHKGHRLVYRYPTQCPTSVLGGQEREWEHFNTQIASIDPEQFSKLFCPKPAMNNALFELTIDDIEYISFPMPCIYELGVGGTESVDGEMGAGGGGGGGDTGGANDCLERQQSSSAAGGGGLGDLDGGILASSQGYAVPTKNDYLDNATANDGSAELTQHKNVIRRFNLVIAKVRDSVRSASQSSSSASTPTLAAYGNASNTHTSHNTHSTNVSSVALYRVVETLSRALLREERRDRYVSGQVATILSLLGNSETSELLSNVRLRERLLLRCGLANEIRATYMALVTESHLRLHINRAIAIDLRLSGPGDRRRVRDVRPYHTLLVLDRGSVGEGARAETETETEAEDKVAGGQHFPAAKMAVPGVCTLLASADPTVPLEQLALQLELPFDDFLALVRHVVFWRAGRIINTITLNSVFQVAPTAVLYGDVVADFQQTFPALKSIRGNGSGNSDSLGAHGASGGGDDDDDGVDEEDNSDCDVGGGGGGTRDNKNKAGTQRHSFGLHGVLALFNGHEALESVIARFPECGREYAVDVVVWLLQRGVVRDIEEFLVQIKPLPADLPPETLRLAAQGTDGDVSLQDLMWREGLSHDDVDRLVARCDGAVVRHRRHADMVD